MPIRVIIVDDSGFIRELYKELLRGDPEIVVVDTAEDPYDAREKIKRHSPDVITLDIEMPKMDGLSFLEKIMTLRPMPVVMASTLTQKGADATIRALEIGAVDYICKPATGAGPEAIEKLRNELITKIKTAAQSRPRQGPRPAASPSRPAIKSGGQYHKKLIAIGASTGGVEAIREVAQMLPGDLPPIVVTQHMPEHFTASFAARLDTLCAMKVKEARNNEPLQPGHMYIAPGNKHLKIAKSAAGFVSQLDEGPPVSGHRPSVDVLFSSVAAAAGKTTVAAILTGMGRDGAAGMKELRDAGAYTFAQSEESCVIYGMPKAAVAAGGVCSQASLSAMAGEIVKQCSEK